MCMISLHLCNSPMHLADEETEARSHQAACLTQKRFRGGSQWRHLLVKACSSSALHLTVFLFTAIQSQSVWLQAGIYFAGKVHKSQTYHGDQPKPGKGHLICKHLRITPPICVESDNLLNAFSYLMYLSFLLAPNNWAPKNGLINTVLCKRHLSPVDLWVWIDTNLGMSKGRKWGLPGG